MKNKDQARRRELLEQNDLDWFETNELLTLNNMNKVITSQIILNKIGEYKRALHQYEVHGLQDSCFELNE